VDYAIIWVFARRRARGLRSRTGSAGARWTSYGSCRARRVGDGAGGSAFTVCGRDDSHGVAVAKRRNERTRDGTTFPVTIQIFYSGDKTTDTGRTIAAPVLKHTVSLNPDETKQVTINLADPAFAGNYGTIFLNSIGSDPVTDIFQTYVQSGFDMWSVGGNAFTGGAFRIPYWTGTTGVVVAVTNAGSFPFAIQFANIGKAEGHSITLVPLSTYRFDSRDYNWDVSGTHSVYVSAADGGVFTMSAYEYRGNTSKYRVVPVRQSPAL
jgi:hypothetical protein